MDIKLRKGQLVWAKVRGYAWWPGVVRFTQVSEIQQDIDSAQNFRSYKITVHFIGENSHSFLPYEKVVDYQNNYDKYSQTNQKVISIQWLKKCIEVADKVLSQEINLNDLPFYNEKLKNSYKKREEKKQIFTGRKKRGRSRASSVNTHQEAIDSLFIDKRSISDSKIKDLDCQLATKIKNKPIVIQSRPRILSQIGIQSKLLDSQKLLYGFIHHFALEQIKPERLTVENVYECLNELINMDISAQQLESCKLLKLIKVFKEEFMDSKNALLQNLAKIAHKLYLYWKRLLIGYELDKISKEEALTEVNVMEDEPKPETPPAPREEAKVEPQLPIPKKRGRPAKKKIETPLQVPNKIIKQTPQAIVEHTPIKQNVLNEAKSVETAESEVQSNSHDLVILETEELISPLEEMKRFENKELRKSLLRRIAKILQLKGLTKQESRERAMNIDRRIKEIDRDFGDKYVGLLHKFKRYIEKLPNKIEKEYRIDIESLTRQFYIQD